MRSSVKVWSMFALGCVVGVAGTCIPLAIARSSRADAVWKGGLSHHMKALPKTGTGRYVVTVNGGQERQGGGHYYWSLDWRADSTPTIEQWAAQVERWCRSHVQVVGSMSNGLPTGFEIALSYEDNGLLGTLYFRAEQEDEATAPKCLVVVSESPAPAGDSGLLRRFR